MEIIYTPKHQLHDPTGIQVKSTPYTTDEVPQRAEIILQALTVAGLGTVLPPRDAGIEPILAIHTRELVDYLQTAYELQAQRAGQAGPVFPEAFPVQSPRYPTRHPTGRAGLFSFGPDCPILAGTWEAAYWSAQCALTGATRLLHGASSVYALCRPPGHHATPGLYGGFCYLNNAAIAARYLQDAGHSRRVAILDIDYHHGNGTQEIFYHDPTVLYCSLHADPDDDYPYYWGGADEAGEGLGEGYNCNWPLPQGTADAEFLMALNEALDATACFGADQLVVSLGLDIAEGDSIGGFSITRQGIERIGAAVAALKLPTLIVQEGGYRLDTLGENAVAFLGSFHEDL
jgi:acetoin utilization deacetylase AcuC-like enzyme